jgi:hypothetical protein
MKSNHAEQSCNICQNRPLSHFKTKKWLTCLILTCTIFSSLPAMAQPSGGPYGPIWQTYDLPKVPGDIYYVAPDGKADESGTTLAKPTTITVAIERVKTGDAIVLRGGVYRTGSLMLNQGITMQPYKDEHPVLKGTDAATQWEHPKDGLWKMKKQKRKNPHNRCVNIYATK